MQVQRAGGKTLEVTTIFNKNIARTPRLVVAPQVSGLLQLGLQNPH